VLEVLFPENSQQVAADEDDRAIAKAALFIPDTPPEIDCCEIFVMKFT
jgi:hypothetical protein